MRVVIITVFLFLSCQTTASVRKELKSYFEQFNGCFLLKNLNTGDVKSFNAARCKERVKPCSTFKVLNSLIGLETKAVDGKYSVIKWDKTTQPFTIWERDHTLESAIKYSVVPYFQTVAQRVGEKRMKEYLKKLEYGNSKIGQQLDRFWLNGALKVSGYEQLDFMEKLYLSRLPFSKRSMKLVREMLIQEKNKDFLLSGKTGSDMSSGKRVLGWFVGYVKGQKDEFVFVTNISSQDGATGRKAMAITKKILKDLEIL